MELLKELLTDILKKEDLFVPMPNLESCLAERIEMKCYNALRAIKAVLNDGALSDFDCIEEIVCVFEKIGSGGGCRHDFG